MNWSIICMLQYDAVVEILSETAWDAPVRCHRTAELEHLRRDTDTKPCPQIAQVRDARNQLLDLLDMGRPQKKLYVTKCKPTNAHLLRSIMLTSSWCLAAFCRRPEADAAVRSAGDSGSYQTLVKEMGY